MKGEKNMNFSANLEKIVNKILCDNHTEKICKNGTILKANFLIRMDIQ